MVKSISSRCFGLGLCLLLNSSAALAAGPVDEAAMMAAWAQYNQQKYVASADAFEALIAKSTPTARLYYYAALANRASNRMSRAKQLSQYVITTFPSSTEATYAQKLFPAGGASPTASAVASSGLPAGLPESMKNKSLEELMQTEEGRKALKGALANPGGAPSGGSSGRGGKQTEHAVTPEMVASDGVSGITQFLSEGEIESAMAAMAMSPRGQKLIAESIREQSPGTYTVRFPGDGMEFLLTPQKIENMRIKDRALWATLVHCALVEKFHRHSSMQTEDILTCLAGKRAEALRPSNTTEQALANFITDALDKKNPIICESGDDFGTLPELVESESGFYITEYEPSTKLITIKNPHGANSRRFRLANDPFHYQKFQQLNDGLFKLNISLFPKYFINVARVSL